MNNSLDEVIATARRFYDIDGVQRFLEHAEAFQKFLHDAEKVKRQLLDARDAAKEEFDEILERHEAALEGGHGLTVKPEALEAARQHYEEIAAVVGLLCGGA